MENEAGFRSVIDVFAHYGFRKASMEDLAQAIGVSRQTLYKRFKSKEAVRDWAVEGFIQTLLGRAETELSDTSLPVEQCLLNAFMRWTGDHVTLLRAAPHGSEIVEIGAAALKASRTDPVRDFEMRVADFLITHKASADRATAGEMAFTLLMASKGLLVACDTSESFAEGMGRVVETLLGKRHS